MRVISESCKGLMVLVLRLLASAPRRSLQVSFSGCVFVCEMCVCVCARARLHARACAPVYMACCVRWCFVPSGVYTRKEAEGGACRHQEAQRHQDAEPREEDSTRLWMAVLDADAGVQAALMRASSGGMHPLDDSSMLQAPKNKISKVSSIVALQIQYTRALTLAEFVVTWSGRRSHPGL